jgi:hypothetical protein
MRRRRTIVPRTPIFLGCEGESEAAYGALLNRLVHETPELHLHIHVEPLQPGAGDPLALVKRAVQKISDLERKRERFTCKAVLLDEADPSKSAAAHQFAAAQGIDHLIRQKARSRSLSPSAFGWVPAASSPRGRIARCSTSALARLRQGANANAVVRVHYYGAH